MDRRPVRAEEFIDRLPQIAVEHLHASVLRIGYGGSREWADLEQLLGILITQITARNLQKHRRVVVGHSDGAVGLSGEGEGVVGKKPPYWGEKEFWTRENFPAIKKAFQGLGEERHAVRTLGEVGFDFETWKEEKDREDKALL